MPHPLPLHAPPTRRLAPLIAILALCCAACPLLAEALPVAADGDQLWRSAFDPDENRTVIYHHPRDAAEDDRLRRVTALAGRLLPDGLAADGGAVWLFFRGGSVQQIRVESAPNAAGLRYDTTVGAPLPSKARAVAVAARGGVAWALLRVERPADLAALDPPGGRASPDRSGEQRDAADRRRRLAMGLPPNPPTKPEADGAAPEPEAPSAPGDRDGNGEGSYDGDGELNFPVHRLVYARGSRWRIVPLPETWPHLATGRIVFERDADERPTLIAVEDRGEAVVYRYRRGAWSEQRLADGGFDKRLQVTSCEGQLVLASVDATPASADRLSAQLRVVRRDGVVGFLAELEGGADRPWRVQPWGGGIGLFAAPRERSAAAVSEGSSGEPGHPGARPQPASATPVAFASFSLRGERLSPRRELTPTEISPWEGRADYILMTVVMVLGVSLTLLTWRQSIRYESVELPGFVPADLWRRLFAALIDLAPPAGIAMLVFGMAPTELTRHWPPQQEGLTWSQMLPAGVVIGLYIVHTAVSEAATGRTLGKRLLGLRVVDARGRTPSPSRALVRGVLKALDLVVWMFLIVAVITPSHQRVGDLVARTLVVSPAKEEPSEEP